MTAGYTMAHFKIPAEFENESHYNDALDQRADQELTEMLQNPPPVTTEKNVWKYWHLSFDNMPSWSQRNVLNWMKLNGPNWTVRVLDTVPQFAQSRSEVGRCESFT